MDTSELKVYKPLLDYGQIKMVEGRTKKFGIQWLYTVKQIDDTFELIKKWLNNES